MNPDVKNSISSKEYARFFLEKSARDEDVIPEVFRLFSVNCIDFCNIDPHELDSLINEFYDNKTDRLQTLTRIIDLRRFSGNAGNCDHSTLYSMILEYVENNFLTDFRIRDMAETLNISYYYMCHLFKKTKGCSLNSYKNTLRLQRAERLLVQSDKTVTDIAFECGFENPGYFFEMFTKYCGCSPSEFRSRIKGTRTYQVYYADKDICQANRMKNLRFLDNVTEIGNSDAISTYEICSPDDKFKFAHGAAIIEYNGVLYASWYNCPEKDLVSHTPVRGKRSYDGGKTWSEVETIDEDPTSRILYNPPAYGIAGGKLYMFINEMIAPDYIHALNLYVLDEKQTSL